jgi:hypothetical protein
MIKFISVEDVLPLRSSELREGKIAPKDMRFSTDSAEGTLHLGYFIKGELVSILTMHRQHYGQYKGEGYQMRGVATLEKFRGHRHQTVKFCHSLPAWAKGKLPMVQWPQKGA